MCHHDLLAFFSPKASGIHFRPTAIVKNDRHHDSTQGILFSSIKVVLHRLHTHGLDCQHLLLRSFEAIVLWEGDYQIMSVAVLCSLCDTHDVIDLPGKTQCASKPNRHAQQIRPSI